MLKNLKAYELAINFYHACLKLNVPSYLRNQLDRASSSIALNIAEGDGRRSTNDRRHFFQIAYGSLRECKAILDLASTNENIYRMADSLGAHLYLLIKNAY